jgi:hypothetical protein
MQDGLERLDEGLVRKKLAAYLTEEVTLPAFRRWFIPASLGR